MSDDNIGVEWGNKKTDDLLLKSWLWESAISDIDTAPVWLIRLVDAQRLERRRL